MHFVGREHFCHASLPKLIRGGQDNDLVRLLCQGTDCAAAGMVDVGESVFFRISVNANKDFVHIIFVGTEFCYRSGSVLRYRILIAAQQN